MTLLSDFENFALMTSWWLFCIFFNAALSFSQLCFDFLQIHRQEILISSNVCYRKLAKSVNNFRSKSGPRLRKIASRFFSRCRMSLVRSPAGTKVLQLNFCCCCDDNDCYFTIRVNDWIYYYHLGVLVYLYIYLDKWNKV